MIHTVKLFCIKLVLLCFLMIKVRIIGDMVKNNCCCEKNNGQNVQEYKNRIGNNLSRPMPNPRSQIEL